MKEFDNVKGKIDNYSLENYDVIEGWGKLQKRNRNKRLSVLRMSFGVAAASVLMVAGYWLLKEEFDMPVPPHDAVSKVKIQKHTKRVGADTMLNGIEAVNERIKLSVLQKISGNVLKHSEERVVIHTELQGAIEKPVEQNTIGLIPEQEVNIEKLPVAIAQKENHVTKPLEVVSEEKLLAMVSAVAEPEPKESKVLHFFISRGEQQEYTTEKYSSNSANISTINY